MSATTAIAMPTVLPTLRGRGCAAIAFDDGSDVTAAICPDVPCGGAWLGDTLGGASLAAGDFELFCALAAPSFVAVSVKSAGSVGANGSDGLATVGSVSPLIGLLGTVLGVMSAFAGIMDSGSGNISAVAPGIAAALSATAAALAVAIPAAFAYNSFAARLNRFDNALEGFGSELIALMVREGRI